MAINTNKNETADIFLITNPPLTFSTAVTVRIDKRGDDEKNVSADQYVDARFDNFAYLVEVFLGISFEAKDEYCLCI